PSWLFFFSSRRRHTRSKRDWSSDVCSSDLAWISSVAQRCVGTDEAMMAKACEIAAECERLGEEEGTSWPYGIGCFRIGLEMVYVLADLKVDGEALPAALLYRSVREDRLSLERVKKEFGQATATLVEGDRKSTRLNSSHVSISYAVFRLKKKHTERE